jgi:hypothetical protein
VSDMWSAPTGGYSGSMTADQLRQMLLKRSLNPTDPSAVIAPGTTMGTSLTSVPTGVTPPIGRSVVPPVVPASASVPTVVVQPPVGAGGPTDPNAAPVRLDRSAVPPSDPAAVPPMPVTAPVVPPAAFPTAAAPAVPYAPDPTISQTGTTLTANPVQDPNAGWGASIGVGNTPEEKKAFDKGSDYQKLMSGLDEIAKGVKPKSNAPSDAATITGGAPQAHVSSEMAAQLMQAMMQGQQQRKLPRGLTLTG